MRERLAQAARRLGARRCEDVCEGALGHHLAAQSPRTGAQIHHVVGAPDGFLVVLHDHDRVAFCTEFAERVEQHVVVARVQPDGGFVEDVTHTAQVRPQLRGQPDALCLTTAQAGCGAFQREIAEPYLAQEPEPCPQFRQDVPGNLAFATTRLEGGEHRRGSIHGHAVVVRDAAVPQLHRERFGLEAMTRAGLAALLTALPPIGPPVFLTRLLRIEALHAEPGAETRRAPAMRGVVGKEARIEFGEAALAAGAGTPRGKTDELRAAATARQHLHHALARIERLVQRGGKQGAMARLHLEFRHGQFDRVLLEPVEPGPGLRRQELSVHAKRVMAPLGSPLRQIGVIALAGDDQGREQHHFLAAEVPLQPREDQFLGLRLDGQRAIGAVLYAELHEQQAQVVVELGRRGHRALATAAAGALLHRHRGRDATDGIHVRPRGRLHELPGVGIQGFQIPPLPFREQDIESDGALAAAADTRDHREGVTWNADIDVFQIVFAGALYLDVGWATQRSCTLHGGRLGDSHALALVFTQGFTRVAGAAVEDLLRGAAEDQLTARLPALGPEIDDPVGGGDHVEVVFDHQQRVARNDQLVESAQQPRDVLEVQPRGGLVEHEQGLAATGFARARLREVAGQFEALRLTAGERGHGLPEREVLEPHVAQGLQRFQQRVLAVEQLQCFGHGERQHVGNAVPARKARFEHLGAESLAVALGAAQIHIAQELHLDVLEAAAGAGRAATVARIEAEGACGVAAFLRHRCAGEQLADGPPGTDVAHGVRARAFADGRLVDQHDVRELRCAAQCGVLAHGQARFTQRLRNGAVQHIAYQRGLAGAADPRHANQMPQRDTNIDVLEVVLCSAVDLQPHRIRRHRTREAALHHPTPREIRRRE